MSVWTGRDDTAIEGPNALRWHQRVKPLTEGAEPGVVLIGFACDEGVRRNGGRVGAREGPRALRKALANMAWCSPEEVYDAGDVNCEDDRLEDAQERLAQCVARIVEAGHLPIVLGGGHETAWGTHQGVFRALPQATIGVINVDAHLDMRQGNWATSGTPFNQIAELCKKRTKAFRYLGLGICAASNTQALADRAREAGASWLLDEQMSDINRPCIIDRITSFVDSVDRVHLSLDLDVLPSWVMPAVSAPAFRGVPLDIVDFVLDQVTTRGKLAAVDVVEYNPRFDHDEHAARIAAGLVLRIDDCWLARPENV